MIMHIESGRYVHAGAIKKWRSKYRPVCEGRGNGIYRISVQKHFVWHRVVKKPVRIFYLVRLFYLQKSYVKISTKK